MKKLICSIVLLSALCLPSFAIGPVPIGMWYGMGAGSYGISINIGADVGIPIPGFTTVYVEADGVGGILPLGFINSSVGINKVGLGLKTNLFTDNIKVRISAGSADVTSSTAFIWGSGTIEKSNVGTYLTVGSEVSFFGIGGMLKASATSIKAGILYDAILCFTINI